MPPGVIPAGTPLTAVRTRAAGQYRFSLDGEQRQREMESLKTERAETVAARSTVVQGAKRKLDARRALVEAKRAKMMGGPEALERKRQEHAAERLLQEVSDELKAPHATLS